jgi:hypothetical protein
MVDLFWLVQLCQSKSGCLIVYSFYGLHPHNDFLNLRRDVMCVKKLKVLLKLVLKYDQFNWYLDFSFFTIDVVDGHK